MIPVAKSIYRVADVEALNVEGNNFFFLLGDVRKDFASSRKVLADVSLSVLRHLFELDRKTAGGSEWEDGEDRPHQSDAHALLASDRL